MTQPSTIPAAASPPRKIVVSQCSSGRCSLIGVLRPNSLYYFFEYEKGKLIPHVCSCQANTTEADLRPLYSEWSDKLGETVIFVYNRVSNKVEQYVCREEFGQLEQVEKSGLIYNSGFFSQSNIIASIDELEEREDEEDEVEEEEEEDSENSIDSEEEDANFAEVNSAYYAYKSKIPQFSITTCLHNNRDRIHVFDYKLDTYITFCYEERTGDFYPFVCNTCPKTIVEDHLYPKYYERAKDNEHVIHVFNSFTQLMEKYVYNVTTGCFEQVDYPELVYDPSKNMTASILYFTTSTPTGMALAIMRDSDGRIKKEQFSQVKKQFVKMPPTLVKTFIRRKRRKRRGKEKEASRKGEESRRRKNEEKGSYFWVSIKNNHPSTRESSESSPSVEEVPRKDVSQEQLPSAPQKRKRYVPRNTCDLPQPDASSDKPTLEEVKEARQLVLDYVEQEKRKKEESSSTPSKNISLEEFKKAKQLILAFHDKDLRREKSDEWGSSVREEAPFPLLIPQISQLPGESRQNYYKIFFAEKQAMDEEYRMKESLRMEKDSEEEKKWAEKMKTKEIERKLKEREMKKQKKEEKRNFREMRKKMEAERLEEKERKQKEERLEEEKRRKRTSSSDSTSSETPFDDVFQSSPSEFNSDQKILKTPTEKAVNIPNHPPQAPRKPFSLKTSVPPNAKSFRVLYNQKPKQEEQL
uniref:Uncharacterized protein n=1 Tax=Caenorhabditis tropicalis TaxID=1561998 RepID=A0A1I7UNU3_9PELO